MVGLKPQSFRVIEGDGAAAAQDESPVEYVGAFLREARETTGRSLAQVATSLCIHEKFLKSIEDGRYEDLPGPTYATGFVRSYADYLGLDTEALLAQFKTESHSVEGHLDLEFPVPSTDGWFPTGKVVAICALLSVVVFASWFYLQTEGSVDVAAVPAPPGFVSTIFPEPARQEPVVATAEAETEPVDENTPDQTLVASVQPVAAEADTATTTNEQATASDGEEPNQLPVAASALIVPDPAATEADPQQPAEAVVETSPPVTDAIAPTPTEPVEVLVPDETRPDADELTPFSTTEAAPPAPPVAKPKVALALPAAPAVAEPVAQVAALPSIPTSSGETAESDGGRTYGVINQEARVVIGARADSWVQVLDDNQNVVLTRLLRAGDRYLVPDRQDLVMLTGNAGGLIISVDGAPVPKIGSDGAILHNVRLDVELLKAGRAVIQ
ncbi:MAG: cytoskeleton protein RodZ [Alphaproteobacteria bacterium]|jgi:cytoskeleton protein RodZ